MQDGSGSERTPGRRPYSLAGVVDGVIRTVSRAVAAEEAVPVLRSDGGVLPWTPGLGIHTVPLQEVVRVLTCSLEETEPDSHFGSSTEILRTDRMPHSS